jgi:hypothetical protein
MSDSRHLQTPVGQQGNRPTCAGFAVSAAHEWMAADGVLRSAEDCLWAAHQQGGSPQVEATSVELALGGLQAQRHAEESAWPYGRPAWPAARPADAQLTRRQRSLPSWHPVASGWVAILDELALGNAVILTLRFVPSAWVDANVDASPGSNAKTNHAVLVVGATEPGDGQPADSLIIKNSWGPAWGDAGYGFVSQRYIDHFTIRVHALES